MERREARNANPITAVCVFRGGKGEGEVTAFSFRGREVDGIIRLDLRYIEKKKGEGWCVFDKKREDNVLGNLGSRFERRGKKGKGGGIDRKVRGRGYHTL